MSIVRRDAVTKNINAADTANPIHDPRVTVSANANTRPASAPNSNNPVRLVFRGSTRNKPNASDAISCNTSAYVVQWPKNPVARQSRPLDQPVMPNCSSDVDPGSSFRGTTSSGVHSTR